MAAVEASRCCVRSRTSMRKTRFARRSSRHTARLKQVPQLAISYFQGGALEGRLAYYQSSSWTMCGRVRRSGRDPPTKFRAIYTRSIIARGSASVLLHAKKCAHNESEGRWSRPSPCKGLWPDQQVSQQSDHLRCRL